MHLALFVKGETERKERGGVEQANKIHNIRKKKFEKYHIPDSILPLKIWILTHLSRHTKFRSPRQVPVTFVVIFVQSEYVSKSNMFWTH